MIQYFCRSMFLTYSGLFCKFSPCGLVNRIFTTEGFVINKAGRLALSSRSEKFSRPLPRIVPCSYMKVESSAKINVFKVSLLCVANFETFVKFS